MISINGGKLNRKVSFFENVLVSDGAGGFIEGSEALVLTTWSSIRQIKASRVAENLQESINAVYEIKLRQRAGFNPQSNYTVKWDSSKVCEITEITEDVDGEKQWVLIVVSRGTGL